MLVPRPPPGGAVVSEMGTLLTRLVVRPLKNVNVENRAQKFIEKAPAKVAPRHPTTVRLLEEFARENRHLLERQKLKDDKLLGHLKDVYVVASSIGPERSAAKKPLPSRTHEDADVVQHVPQGRITLSAVNKLLVEYQDNPDLDALAHKYKLDVSVAKDILNNFTMLQLHAPPSEAASSQAGRAAFWLPTFFRKRLT